VDKTPATKTNGTGHESSGASAHLRLQPVVLFWDDLDKSKSSVPVAGFGVLQKIDGKKIAVLTCVLPRGCRYLLCGSDGGIVLPRE
jgi:hypothetical protein